MFFVDERYERVEAGWSEQEELHFEMGSMAGAMTAVVALAYNPALRGGLPHERRAVLQRELDAAGGDEDARRHATADAYVVWLLDLAADEWERTPATRPRGSRSAPGEEKA